MGPSSGILYPLLAERAELVGRAWADQCETPWAPDSTQHARYLGGAEAEANRLIKWFTGFPSTVLGRTAFWLWLSGTGLHVLALVWLFSEDFLLLGLATSLLAWFATVLALVLTVVSTSSRSRFVQLQRQLFVRGVFTALFERLEQRRAESGPPRGNRPEPQPYGVSAAGAEELCAAWMRYYGATDAVVTRRSGDGGVDIVSEGFIAQVKNYVGTVPIGDVRQLMGVAVRDGRKTLFFTSGSYPQSAIEFADSVGMALFRFDAVLGELTGANRVALALLHRGLHR